MFNRQVATGPTPNGPRSRRQDAVTPTRGRRPLVLGKSAQVPGRVTPHCGAAVADVVTRQPVNDDEVWGIRVVGVPGLDELDETRTEDVVELEELVRSEVVLTTDVEKVPEVVAIELVV